jgi:hypothetical protein
MCCPKKKFWTKQKTITPSFKLVGPLAAELYYMLDQTNTCLCDLQWIIDGMW